MVHPQRVKGAKLKNDRVGATMLAHRSRCDLLPEARMAGEATQLLRLRVRLRIASGRQVVRSMPRGTCSESLSLSPGMVDPVEHAAEPAGDFRLAAVCRTPSAWMISSTLPAFVLGHKSVSGGA